MKFFIFIAVALLFFPLATAFNCNSLTGGEREICNSIQQSPGLNSQEKDLLISDIFNPNKTSPNHDFVYIWNTNLNILNDPDNGEVNKGTIRNAWVKIISIMPSVLENNVLYVPDRGKIQTEFNYNVQLPSGRQGSDCKTRYYLESQTTNLNVYVNNRFMGHNKLQNYWLNEKDAKFYVILDIEVRYRIKHYRWDDNDDDCDYHHSNYVTDYLKLVDVVDAKLYEKNPESDFKITNKYYGTTSGELTAEDYTALELSFKDSLFEKTNYAYSFDYELPYYVLTIKADKVENKKIENLRITEEEDKFEFAVENPENCRIRLSNHFESFSKSCNLNYNEFDLKIKTDKLNYVQNETIKVEIFPKDVLVELSYANQTTKAENNADFDAVLNYNKITSKSGNSKVSKIINVTDKKNKDLVIDLSFLGLFGYVIYSFLKKYSFNLI